VVLEIIIAIQVRLNPYMMTPMTMMIWQKSLHL